MSSTLPKSGYVPLELAAGAFLSLGEGLADFAGDPPFAQKMLAATFTLASKV